MSTNPSHLPRRQSALGATTLLHPTAAPRIAWLRFAFSTRFASAPEDIERRLGPHRLRSGITCCLADQSLLLLGRGRPVTPADWTAVIDGLLRQPEVVDVTRELSPARRLP